MTRRLPTISLTLALILAACGASADETLSGFERTPTPIVNNETLPEVTDAGSPFRFEASQSDGVLVVYFGYTNCPDVCPTTLFDLRTALDSMNSSQQDRIETAMVTIDPNRDTDEVITGYVRSFLPEAAAVRTTVDEDLRVVADAFGADYGVTETAEGEFDVLHTGSLYAVNGAGELLVSWPFGVTSEDLVKDLGILLERGTA